MKSLSQRVPLLAAAIAAALVLSLGLQPVSPAVASGPVLSLPEGDRAIAMWCNTDELMGFLFEIDMASGTTDRDANRVGTWQRPTDTDQIVFVDNSDPDNPVTTTRSAYGCALNMAFNPVDGLGYWLSFRYDDNNNALQRDILVSVDLETGVNTVVAVFANDFKPQALAINDNGEAWVTARNESPSNLHSLNLATGAVTLVGPTKVEEDISGTSAGNTGLSWDPVSEKIYAYNTGSKRLYVVNTGTDPLTKGNFTPYSSTQLFDGVFTPYAIHFDSDGQLWGSADDDIGISSLSDLSNFQKFEIDLINGGDRFHNFWAQSIIIAPAASAPLGNNNPGGSFVTTPAAPTDSLKKVVRMKKLTDNKVSLPARAKRELRTNVRSMTTVTSAVCTGYVSNPRVASFTKKQARERAVRACNIVKRLQPAAEVRTRVVVVDDAKLPRLRSVRVALIGN